MEDVRVKGETFAMCCVYSAKYAANILAPNFCTHSTPNNLLPILGPAKSQDRGRGETEKLVPRICRTCVL